MKKRKERKERKEKTSPPSFPLNGATQTFSSAAVRIIWVIFSLCSPNISLHIRLTQLMCLSCCVGPSSWPSRDQAWAGPGRAGGLFMIMDTGPGPKEGRKRGVEGKVRGRAGKGRRLGLQRGRRVVVVLWVRGLCYWKWSRLYWQSSSFYSSFDFAVFACFFFFSPSHDL